MAFKVTILPKVDQSWTIEKIAKEAVPSSWRPIFKNALPELIHISQKLDKEAVFGSYLPLKCQLFNAFLYTKLSDVKVILLDFEPTTQIVNIVNVHGVSKSIPRDQGLAYSLHYDDNPTKALNVIYQELQRSIKGFQIPQHGDLTKWAQQGVLLLHQCLTNSIGKSHSEYNFWHDFLKKVFKGIAEANPNTIVLLWGRKIQCVRGLFPDSFVILECPSAPDDMRAKDEFLGCNHFKKVNDLLMKQKQTPIDWNL